jgi:RNA polymerase sigma-70 factor (ECF subfamily)
MIFRRQNKKATSFLEAEAVNFSAGIFRTGPATLSIEEKVKQHFEQLREPVFRYLVATFGESSQAEEIMQESFLRLYSSLSDGQNILNVKAWVFRVAHNLAINQIKSRQFIQPLAEGAWTELERTLQSKDANPEQKLLQKEKYNRLRMALGKLNMTERECLNLRTKGFRYKEIGEILELSTTTVAETLYRVIEKLAKETNG